MKIEVPIELGKIETMSDGGTKIVIYTSELSPEQRTVLFSFAHKTAYMALAEVPIDTIDVPETLPDVKGDRSPSQKLRGAIWSWWDRIGRPLSGFPVFYETQIDKIIDEIRAK